MKSTSLCLFRTACAVLALDAIHCGSDAFSTAPVGEGGAPAANFAGDPDSLQGAGFVDAGSSVESPQEPNALGGGHDASADALVAPEVAKADADVACPGLFCEDFERGQLDTARWNVATTGGATFDIETGNVAHGKYAVRFHGLGAPAGGATSAYIYLLTKNTPAELKTHNFGRAYYFITPQPRSINLGMLFGGTSGFPKPTYLSIAEHSGGWQLGFIKLSGSPTGERQAYPTSAMPVMRWSCLEWELDDAPDTIHLWGDGQPIGVLDPDHVDYPAGHVAGTPIFAGASSGLVGGFTDFGFGFYDWHPSGFDFDLYYDDIVLDTRRVGCL